MSKPVNQEKHTLVNSYTHELIYSKKTGVFNIDMLFFEAII